MCLSSKLVSGVAFKPDNTNIHVSCSWDKTIKMWDITSGSCVSTLRGHRYVPSLSREYFLSCFRYLYLVCLSSGKVLCVAFKPDNPNILVSCSWDKTIKMWDITAGSCLSTLTCDRYDATLLYDCPVCGHFTAKCFNTVMLHHADLNLTLTN